MKASEKVGYNFPRHTRLYHYMNWLLLLRVDIRALRALTEQNGSDQSHLGPPFPAHGHGNHKAAQ